MPPSQACRRRRGAIAPLAAILLVFLVGMVAFAVDTSWIALTRSELQNTADAAALAGAGQLMKGYVQYNLPKQSGTQKSSILTAAMASAKASAREFAAYNTAGSVGPLVLNDADIEFGFTDQVGNYTVSTASGPYPNTVKVTMRRDSQANGPLKLFFAPVLGVDTINVLATASATCYSATYDTFALRKGDKAGMLPITYDVNFWNNFLSTGQDPDGNANVDASGNPVLQVYPSIKAPGNFGELSLDDSHTGAGTTAGWIAHGMSASDVQALTDNGLLPLSQHKADTWDWQGNSGFKASNVMEINANVGTTYYLPLFQPVTSNLSNYQAGVGQGANYYYDIVSFVSVTIMPSPKGSQQIWVQPGPTLDPSAVFGPGTVVPMGTTSSLATTFTTPKLSN